MRVKKTFWNVQQAFVFLIIQSGLLKRVGWWRGQRAAHDFSELNLPKSAEAENTFFQFIKGSKLSVRCLSQLSWERAHALVVYTEILRLVEDHFHRHHWQHLTQCHMALISVILPGLDLLCRVIMNWLRGIKSTLGFSVFQNENLHLCSTWYCMCVSTPLICELLLLTINYVMGICSTEMEWFPINPFFSLLHAPIWGTAIILL